MVSVDEGMCPIYFAHKLCAVVCASDKCVKFRTRCNFAPKGEQNVHILEHKFETVNISEVKNSKMWTGFESFEPQKMNGQKNRQPTQTKQAVYKMGAILFTSLARCRAHLSRKNEKNKYELEYVMIDLGLCDAFGKRENIPISLLYIEKKQFYACT